MVKLISLDLDGTLLTPEGTVTAASKAAIAKARAAGVRVIVNTGRPIQEGIFFAREAGCDSLAAGAGGAIVMDGDTGELLFCQGVAQPSARRALELCLSWDTQLIIYAGTEFLVTPEYEKELAVSYPFPAFHEAVTVTEDFFRFMQEHKLPLVKIHGELDAGPCPVEQLAALPGVALTSSTSHDFELTAAGADKGRALEVIAARYGIPLEQCAAVGDSSNDLSILQAAGVPVAMGNAPRTVKDAAVCVAPSNAEEGAAWAVLRCLEWN